MHLTLTPLLPVLGFSEAVALGAMGPQLALMHMAPGLLVELTTLGSTLIDGGGALPDNCLPFFLYVDGSEINFIRLLRRFCKNKLSIAVASVPMVD